MSEETRRRINDVINGWVNPVLLAIIGAMLTYLLSAFTRQTELIQAQQIALARLELSTQANYSKLAELAANVERIEYGLRGVEDRVTRLEAITDQRPPVRAALPGIR